MPATYTLLLIEARQGWFGVRAGASSPFKRNATRNCEPSGQAGALKRATSGWDVGVTTAADFARGTIANGISASDVSAPTRTVTRIRASCSYSSGDQLNVGS